MEKGVEATTVDEIAKSAGYSKATLYVYFQNKEEIYFSLVYRHMEKLCETIGNVVGSKADSQKEWIENYLEICFYVQKLCREYPIYFEGMIGNINVDITSDKTPQIYKDIYSLGLHMGELVKKMPERGVELGYFESAVDTNAIMIFLWSSLSGIVRMSEHKTAYYALLGLDNDEFLKKEFLSLLTGCKNMQGD